MGESLVTIGLPVYNGGNYLEEAIDSLLAQTLADFRLIIADNASTDETEEICRATATGDSRIEYHRHVRNFGAAANYNFAVERSSSPYFMWQAHDDLRDPRFLAKAVAAHDMSPDASIVFSRARRIGPEGESGDLMDRPDALMSDDPADRIRAAITCTYPDIPLFGLMRTDLLKKTGKHGNFQGGDRLLVAEMALLGRFVELEEVLFFNRDHPHRYVRISGKRREDKVLWWDTTRRGAISLPRWRGFIGYLTAVHRYGPDGPGQKRRAYSAVLRSTADNRFYVLKQLFRELVAGTWVTLAGLLRSLSERLRPRADHR